LSGALFDRRAAVGTIGLLGLSGCFEKKHKNQNNDCGFYNGFIGEEFGLGEGSDQAFVGPGLSRHKEIRHAFKLLWDSPRTSNHLEMARYFENILDVNLDEKDRNGNPAKYNEEWKTRSNPLITSFFALTNYRPVPNDETSWCAAFVSFVLSASEKPSTFSALSGSYKTYSEKTDDPKPGDLAVFQKTGPDGEKGFGHVGFYVDHDDDGIYVLGGNQRGDSGSSGAVITTHYVYSGSRLFFHSYRKVY